MRILLTVYIATLSIMPAFAMDPMEDFRQIKNSVENLMEKYSSMKTEPFAKFHEDAENFISSIQKVMNELEQNDSLSKPENTTPKTLSWRDEWESLLKDDRVYAVYFVYNYGKKIKQTLLSYHPPARSNFFTWIFRLLNKEKGEIQTENFDDLIKNIKNSLEEPDVKNWNLTKQFVGWSAFSTIKNLKITDTEINECKNLAETIQNIMLAVNMRDTNNENNNIAKVRSLIKLHRDKK